MVLLWTLYSEPLVMVLFPQFWDTFYISEVNGAMKIISDRQGSYEQELGPHVEFF